MDNEYSLTTDINGIRNLKSSVEYLLSIWPGSPARPAQEQEQLWELRDELNKCILQHTFDTM